MDIHIIPANPNIYEVIGAFNEFHKIDWKNQPVEVGYLYLCRKTLSKSLFFNESG